MDALAALPSHEIRINHRPFRRVFFDERARHARPPGPTGSSSYQTGLLGESVVAEGLVAAGWRILGHRVRTKVGEVDLIARRGDTVVFAEVKTAGPGRIAVTEAVPERSRQRIRRAAVAWMAGNARLHAGARQFRFDVFFVYRDGAGGIVRIDHVRDAF